MIRLGGLVNQKTFGKFEQGKVYSNPFATAFVNEGVDMDKLEFELKHLKKSNPGKKVGYHFIKSSEYPNGYYFTVNKKIIKNIFKNEAEGSEDHEVSMAQNSLDTIIKNATELKQKIGEMEKNIPGWIQDHITNSENYIEQANSGYHEINEGKINELAPNDVHVKEIMNFYDNGTYSTKKAVSIFVSGKTNANRNQILDDLGDMGYNDIWDVMNHFKLDI
jgi:vacuolar-type H+-ATPase subunit H